jgi:hypothetical protein
MGVFVTWLLSFGNTGAVANAAKLAQRKQEDDFMVLSLTRRLHLPELDAAAQPA